MSKSNFERKKRLIFLKKVVKVINEFSLGSHEKAVLLELEFRNKLIYLVGCLKLISKVWNFMLNLNPR